MGEDDQPLVKIYYSDKLLQSGSKFGCWIPQNLILGLKFTTKQMQNLKWPIKHEGGVLQMFMLHRHYGEKTVCCSARTSHVILLMEVQMNVAVRQKQQDPQLREIHFKNRDATRIVNSHN